MKSFCILIPAYKYDLYDYEKLSLNRIIDFITTNNMLDNVIFIIPENFYLDKFIEKNLNQSLYNKFIHWKYKVYNEEYFNSIIGYNNCICLSYKFYYDFINYDYMLIYQLDGYIFDNQLEYFINQEYDYIGGYIQALFINDKPKLLNDLNKNYINNIYMNGGVSLRKIQFCKDCISNPNAQKYINGIENLTNIFIIAEDLFFSAMYKTPIKTEDLLQFSYNYIGFADQYIFNDKRYPFVCHGIHRNKHLMNLVQQYNKENSINYL